MSLDPAGDERAAKAGRRDTISFVDYDHAVSNFDYVVAFAAIFPEDAAQVTVTERPSHIRSASPA